MTPASRTVEAISADQFTDLDDLWAQYLVGRDQILRNVLIEAYLPLIDDVVSHLPERLLHVRSREELREIGAFGLIDAVEHHESDDATAGGDARFVAYARLRIRGTIFDELRRLDHLSRSARHDVSAYRDQQAKLTSSEHRTPTHDEILSGLGIFEASRKSLVTRELQFSSELSLDIPISDDGSVTRLDLLRSAGDEEEEILAQLDAERLRGAIRLLPANQRDVITDRFFAGLTQEEVANSIGISKTRVAQIERAALTELRRSLAALAIA